MLDNSSFSPIDYKYVHPNFRMNGVSLNKTQLYQIAYSFIKEGKPFENEIGCFLLDWLDENEAIELKTSGTTGTPKIIMMKKQAMVNSAIATATYFDLHYSIDALLCLPAQYIAGRMMIVRALVLGWNLDYVPPSSNPLEFLEDKYYHFAAMVPLQVEGAIKKLQNVKTIIIGGAQLSDSIKNKVMFHKGLYETYGMTETVSHVAVKKIDSDFFTTMPGVIISQDQDDCLKIFYEGITEVELTTNDIVQIINDKNFKWVGRRDNVINSGGIKLIPELIEAKIKAKVDCELFCIGRQDERLGEKLVLCVESDFFEFKEVFKTAKLTDYETPKEVYFIQSFIRTDTGKILRNATFSQAVEK